MPRTPDGRLRAPTEAEINLGDHIADAIERVADDPDHEGDAYWLAVAAVSAVVEQGWTPPDPGWIPPARPDIPGQFDLLAPPTSRPAGSPGHHTTETR